MHREGIQTEGSSTVCMPGLPSSAGAAPVARSTLRTYQSYYFERVLVVRALAGCNTLFVRAVLECSCAAGQEHAVHLQDLCARGKAV